MNFAHALMATIALAVSPGEGMSREQLVQLIGAAQEANCRDVSFDYEGSQVIRDEAGVDKVELNYTGTFTRRSDGAMLADIYLLNRRVDNASRAAVAILDGTTGSMSQRADQKNADIAIKKQGPLEYAGPGNFRQVWLADYVKKLADSPYRYEFERFERLDGEECAVVRFRLVVDDSTPKDMTASLVFWVDLNRGGHVVRFEERYWGENMAALTTARLGRFERGQGRAAWLPISGRHESHTTMKDKKTVFVAESVVTTSYALLPVTLRFDRGLKDDAFSVKARQGDAISDEVRKARYEFGQYMVRYRGATRRPTDAEIKANLDRMLKDSSRMAGELRASSPLRDGPGLASYWPWPIAGIAILGAGFFYYKQRNP